MPVYIDDYNAPFRRMIMCHMVADTVEELHAMADKIGVKRKWFQGDHYDICLSKKRLAIKYGAQEIGVETLVKVLKRWKKKYGNTRKKKHK